MPKKKLPSSSKKAKKSKKKEIKNNSLKNNIIGLIFVSVALALLIFPIRLPTPKHFDKNPIVISSSLLTSKKTNNTPVKIVIPKSDIDIPIVEAKIVDGYWELSETTASYGLGSGYPGTASNIVIFAHAKEGLFYNLKNAKIGDAIYVFTKNKWYGYKVNKITAVYPNQTEVIQPTKKETLTIYTCTGFNDEKRLIITALPQN